MFLINSEDTIVMSSVFESFAVSYFIGLTKERVAGFQSRIYTSEQPNIFSTYKINKNDWYIKRYFDFNIPMEHFDIKLTEDDLLELKLKYGKLLILSEFHNTENNISNIMFTKFVSTAGKNTKYLVVNQFIKTLLHMIKPEAVIFEGSFENTLIDYIKSISNFKYVPYEEFLDYTKDVYSLNYF